MLTNEKKKNHKLTEREKERERGKEQICEV